MAGSNISTTKLLLLCLIFVSFFTKNEAKNDNSTFVALKSKLGVTYMYDYAARAIAYKDAILKICHIERMQGQAFWENPRTLQYFTKPLTRNEIELLGGSRIANFCFGWLTFLLQQPVDVLSFNNPGQRNKRSNSHYFVGRVRGQTQSQYLNFGDSNNKDPGKAEAEINSEGSRAIVSGSNGMGQAQSQSNPFSCADCFGQSPEQYDFQKQAAAHERLPGQLFQQTGTPSQTGQGIFGPQGSQIYPGGKPEGVIGRPGLPGGAQIGRPGSDQYPGSTPSRGDTGRTQYPGQIPEGTGTTQDRGRTQQPGYPGGIEDGSKVPDHLRPVGTTTQAGRGGQYPPTGVGQQYYPTSAGQQHPQVPAGTGIQQFPSGVPGGQYPQGPPTDRIQPGGQTVDGQVGYRPSQYLPGQPSIPGYPQGYIPSRDQISQQLPSPQIPGQQIPGQVLQVPGQITQQIPGRASMPGLISQIPGQIPGQVQIPGQGPQVPSQITQRMPGQIQYPGQQLPGQASQYPGQIVQRTPGQISQTPGQVTPQLPGQVSQDPGQISQQPSYGDRWPGQYQQVSGQFPDQKISQQGPGAAGTFSGKVTGGYQSNLGHTGEFSGTFTGNYNAHPHVPGEIRAPGEYQQKYPIGPGGPGTDGQYIPTATQQGVPGYIPGQSYAPTTQFGQPGAQYGPGVQGYLPGVQISEVQPGQGTYTPEQISGAQPQGTQFGPGTGTGRTYIPGVQTGQIYSPGTQAGQGYLPGSQTGHGYLPGTQTGQGYVPGTQSVSGYLPGTQTGQAFLPGTQTGVQTGQGYIPGPQTGQGYSPGAQTGQGYLPGPQIGQAYLPVIQTGQVYPPGTQPSGYGIPTSPTYLPGVHPSGPGQTPGGQGYFPGTQIPGRIPTEAPDDANSQAQSSIQQISNGTEASASSQGKFMGGTAQSQVSGTYSGSGSFSASAGTNDGLRGAQTQVMGGKEGAISSAQGLGGKGQSQAQVQLSSETGDTTSSAQSGGVNHGTNTQVQAGGKGGMADAQANGPGSTSSQANIGFKPYDENQEENQDGPFGGGGSASAQSGTNAGQSQVLIQGKYKYGIKYTGGAQASSASNPGDIQRGNFPTMKPLQFGKKDENSDSLKLQRSTPHNNNNIATKDTKIVKVVTSTTTESPEDYSAEYDEYDEEESEKPKDLVEQQKRAQRHGHLLDPVEDLERNGPKKIPLLKNGDILQPGQLVPGTLGYQIPSGFRGKVSTGESISITPNTRRIVYKNPVYVVAAKTNSKPGDIGYGSGYSYQPIQAGFKSGKSYPKFVSVTKSETGSKNVQTGKKVPSVYYTQSSSCGYFTNTCFYSNGQKICMPKPKTNPDGSPIIC